jgi:two-component system, sensor histidine kinase and response regulator
MKTILLVDDDLQLRTMFAIALRRQGYNVIEADSGASGLKMAREHLPDLILSDVHMPGGDGSTLLRDIRRDPALRSKQVVLITGRPDLITPRKGMEDGADDFLVKPSSLQALETCIEVRLSRSSVNWRVEEQMLTKLQASIPAHLPHEFFTPLAGIIGLMEFARSEGTVLTSEEVKDIHNDVYLSALRLHRTLRNYLLILDLQTAIPEVKVIVLTPSEVEEAIQIGVNETLRLNQRKVDVTVQVKGCPISIKREDLSRIVEELVDNAFKFSRQGTRVKVEFNSDGRLSVTDQGRGLTAEQVSQIGAFQQFDRKKHEQQGLGLGLVLVQKLASVCQATFSAISRPGEGTVMHIGFPLTST